MAPRRPREAKILLNIAKFVILGALGGVLDPSWMVLGASRKLLGASWRLAGPSRKLLEGSWRPLKAS